MRDEEGNVRALYDRVAAALEGVGDWELVVTDDGSKDGTGRLLAELAAADERVKVITLSRNFGHQPAITAGLEHASGDAVVMIDADLQDPPELIPDMVARWRDGADVVYAVRQSREGETRMKLFTAHVFYRLMARLAQIELPVDSGDFRLMDRRALEALLAMPERSRFLRGMTVWIGFTQTAVPYQRQARVAGETKFSLSRMLRFSFDAISSFSYFPLQLATVLGFLISGLAFLAIPLTVVARLQGIFVPGISSTLVVILLLGGIQLITLGVVGEYVGRIYDEVKRRPLYVVRETANVDDEVGPRSHARTGWE
ncbi:MAG: polyisoprenyl-phosphate glycosyltransferase [Solirubrobacteraceae bacterium]|jgi:glycosyltransferase involved in cell wall biosynthesis|nr:polyisoprenyl-phosphate glycosyltransferase [Solirubrobacteraceae bacterium]